MTTGGVRLKLLLAEDSDDDARLVLRELDRGGLQVDHTRVQTAEAFSAALASSTWDLIICDFSMPTFSAPAALKLVQQHGLDLPFIIVSGTVGEDAAVEAMRSGARDYLMKGNLTRLPAAVQRELREAANRAERAWGDRALRQSEARFRALVENAPDLVVVVREGRLVYLNPSAVSTLGFTRADEVLGKPTSLLVHPDHQQEFDARVGSLGMTGAASPLREERWLRKDGQVVVVEVSAQLLDFDGGPSLVALARDVTERSELTRRMMQMDRLVAVGTLAAGVGHEINNPLAYILSNLAYLSREFDELGEKLGAQAPSLLPKLSELKEVLSETTDGAERVRNIVRDLKTFSRGEEDRVGPVELRRIIESSVNLARNELRQRGALVIEHGDIPLVLGNESRLGQVVLNLLVNAAQALPEGESELHEVRVRTFRDGARAVLEVRDTGAGIPPDVLPRIFDPFFTTKPVGQGTGLGLAISQGIVRDLGGELQVQSEVGKGSVFRVVLQVAGLVPDAAPVSVPVPAGKTGARILFIDDEPMLGIAVRRLLAPRHQVIAVTSGKEALDLLARAERFDLVYCDLMMPGMTGMELHAELERSHPELAKKVVFTSGGAFTDAALEFLDRVNNPRLSKPFELDTLLAQLEELLGRA